MFWLFKRKPKASQLAAEDAATREPAVAVVDEHGNPEDPILAAMVNEAFHSGGMVVGKVDDDGNLTMERHS